MTVKILIKRRFKDASPDNVSAVIGESRRNAMRQEGYISSESLCGSDDPKLIMVISMWQSKEHWETYKNSSVRKETEQKFSSLFEQPTEYESFNLGLPFAMGDRGFVEPLEF